MSKDNSQLILMVEDSDIDFETTLRAFKKSNIHNPLHRCQDGDEALDYLFHRGKYQNDPHWRRPGLVLLDLNLPGTDGREVLEEAKKDESLKKIPIIVLTTSNDEVDINRCYKAGANSYIVKPVTIEGAIYAVERLKDFWLEIAILPRG
jgi:two-component system response regulator